MSSSSSTTPTSTSSIHLRLDQRVALSGSPVTGYVEINPDSTKHDGIHSVLVRLRGTTQTIIAPIDSQTPPCIQTVEFIKLDVPLWSSSSPSSSSRTLSLPFSLVLPPTLPPSFSGSVSGCGGTIMYTIEAIGKRSGLFKSNRRVVSDLTIVATSSVVARPELRQSLKNGWTGPWKSHVLQKGIRKGALAQLKVELLLPDVESYPTSLSVPYKLLVTSSSKPTTQSPTPPSGLFRTHTAADVTLRLERTLKIRASGSRETIVDMTTPLGGLGTEAKSVYSAPRSVNTRWIPGAEVWEQVETFVGRLALVGVPSFSTNTLSGTYALHIRIDDLKLDVPISLCSGVGDFVDAPPSWSPEPTQLGDLGIHYKKQLQTCS